VAESLERQSMNQTSTATGESDGDRALSELSAKDARSFEVTRALQRNAAMLWSVRKVASGFVERSCVAPVIRPLGVGGRMPVSKWQTCEKSSSFIR
jgi:hypothetical protein